MLTPVTLTDADLDAIATIIDQTDPAADLIPLEVIGRLFEEFTPRGPALLWAACCAADRLRSLRADLNRA